MKIKNFEDFVALEKGSLLIFFDGFIKMILIFDKISSLTGKDFFDDEYYINLRVFVLKDSLFFRNNGKYKTYSFYKSNLKNLEIFLK